MTLALDAALGDWSAEAMNGDVDLHPVTGELLGRGASTSTASRSRNLREIHLDFLLLEELETNPAFARHLFEVAFGAEDLPAGLPTNVHALRGVWDEGGVTCLASDAGENDLDVIAEWEPGVERRLLIEDKVRAGFQFDQARRSLARARSRLQTRCLLVAPQRYIAGHPGEVKFFEKCGAAVAIEELAAELEATTSLDGGYAALRVAWRAEALRELTVPPPRPPDHAPTVAFSDWCMRAFAGWGPAVVPAPIRTVNEGWIYFHAPDGLYYKCSHGRVDLQVNHVGDDGGVEDVQRRVGDTLPTGFEVTHDDCHNTVLRYQCEKVSPQRDLGPDGEPIQSAGVKDALSACVAITHWLERVGRRLLVDAPTPAVGVGVPR
jgi:hypothetical protein